jgi:hypothetical protein
MHDIDRTFMELESEGFTYGNEAESEVFNENEIEELASELLSVSSEAELDQFLGDLIKKAGKAVGKFVKSPIGKSIGGMLKGVAKTALPMVGSALGNMVLPGVGGAIGSQLASGAGSAFGLELEGLSQEDQEFEVAKQFVRLASDATKNALSGSNKPAPAAAKDALIQSAQKFAPGLLQGGARRGGAKKSGRWVRQADTIVLYGV